MWLSLTQRTAPRIGDVVPAPAGVDSPTNASLKGQAGDGTGAIGRGPRVRGGENTGPSGAPAHPGRVGVRVAKF